MLVSIFNDQQLFLDLDVLSRLKKDKNVSVHDKNIICKRGNTTVAFGILTQDIPNGTYSSEKLNNNEISFNRVSDVVTIQKPTIEGSISECETLQCDPMIGSALTNLIGYNFSFTVASIIKTRRMGREVFCFTLESGFFINSGNLNILVNEGLDTCNKFIQGIPEDQMSLLSEQAATAGVSVNSIILNKLKNPPAPSVPAAPSVPKTNKTLQGIPKGYMSVLTERAAAMGISVNKLILGLIETSITGVARSIKPPSHTRNKLLTGIPLTLMTTLKTNAAASGLSVNKYILEVLKND